MVPQDKPQNADPSGPLEELLCLGWKKLRFYSPAKGRKDLYHARIFSGGGAVQQGFYPIPGPDFFWGGWACKEGFDHVPWPDSLPAKQQNCCKRTWPKTPTKISRPHFQWILQADSTQGSQIPLGNPLQCAVAYLVCRGWKKPGRGWISPCPSLPPFLPRGGGYDPKNMPDSTSHLPSGSHKKALGENSTSIILRAWAESIRKSVGIHCCSQVLDFPATCLGFSNILPNELVMGFEEQLQADSRREEKREERGE